PWRIGMAVKLRNQFETDTLPRYIEKQRWYGGKGAPIKRARLVDHAIWEQGKWSWLLPLLVVETAAEDSHYFVPLAMAWEEGAGDEDERLRSLTAAAVARVRQQANVGVMSDAYADECYCRALVEAIGARRELPTASGRLVFRPTAAYAELVGDEPEALAVGKPLAQSSNTLVAMGERLFLKGYRRLHSGVNPEFEVGRFL